MSSSAIFALIYLIAAAAATLCDGLELVALYRVLKPLPIILAMIMALRAATPNAPARLWLFLALGGSLAGDILLLSPQFFIPGLAAFLLAHIAYIVRFTRDAPWFPRGLSALIIGAAGVSLFVFEARFVPQALLVPVAAYSAVISAMAAQAYGRAQLLKNPAAWRVAIGALIFVASDTILSVDKFIVPFPAASVLNSITYYFSQYLLVTGLIARGYSQARD